MLIPPESLGFLTQLPGTVSVPMICVIGLPFWMKNSPKASPNPALAGRKPHATVASVSDATVQTSGTGSSCTRFLSDVKVVRNTQFRSLC